jgi:hypothetical protein
MSKLTERVVDPLIVVYRTHDRVICEFEPNEFTHKDYGILITGVVRHVAHVCEVHEDDVWEVVNQERRHPTTVMRTS